jgi:hypothetical protein
LFFLRNLSIKQKTLCNILSQRVGKSKTPLVAPFGDNSPTHFCALSASKDAGSLDELCNWRATEETGKLLKELVFIN